MKKVQRRSRGGAAVWWCALVAVLCFAPPGEAASTEMAPAKAVAWIDATRIDLASLAPDAPDDDLESLSSWLRDVEVVGIGDGSHGTHEFYRIKQRLIQYLVESAGTRTILFEGPWPEFNRINAYIQGAAPSFPGALASEWWFWNTSEIIELIEWAREWNMRRPVGDRIEFRGVDMAIPRSLLDDAASLASRPEASSIRCFRDVAGYFQKTAKEQAECRGSMLRLRDRLAMQAGQSARTAEVLSSVEMLLQSESLYRQAPRYDFAQRDALMAANIIAIRAARRADGPVIFWAHNGHVGTGLIPFHRNQRAVGSYLDEQYGERYFSIGSITAEGDFHAWDPNSTDPLRRIRYPKPEARSYEHLLGQADSDSFILATRGREAKRALGARALSFGMGGPSVVRPVVELTDLFDAVIFIRRTTPTGRPPAG